MEGKWNGRIVKWWNRGLAKKSGSYADAVAIFLLFNQVDKRNFRFYEPDDFV
jgi:hypothetical protein